MLLPLVISAFISIFKVKDMHKKMDKGEVAFHIAIPLIMATIITVMGYYSVMLTLSLVR